MTRPVKEAPSAAGKPGPVCRSAWKIRKAILAIPATKLSSAGKVLLSVVADHAGYGRFDLLGDQREPGFLERTRDSSSPALTGRTHPIEDGPHQHGLADIDMEDDQEGRQCPPGPGSRPQDARMDRADSAPAGHEISRPAIHGLGGTVVRPPGTEQLCPPGEEQLCHQNSPSLELPHGEQSSSSSSTPRLLARENRRRRRVRSRSQESGGSKQKAKLIPDAEGREMVCRVADRCTHLPGIAGEIAPAGTLETSDQARLAIACTCGDPTRSEGPG